ncbi:MAG: SusC/RagA family TonB-linked outer membrane protein, partial [Draconibacterium sp.]
GNIEFYKNRTKDILYDIQLPVMTGFSSIPKNIGEVKNWGLEFSLTGRLINTKKTSWSATVNFSRIRNKIVSILGSNLEGIEEDLVANRLFIGEPQNVLYDYEITGELWQLADETAGTIHDGFLPGTLKIVDQNTDGKFSASEDMKILGYADPSYKVGIANNFRYGNFGLYVFINSIQGGKNYYLAPIQPDWGMNNYEFITQGNGIKGSWDYWMPENPNSKYRRVDSAPTYEGINYDQRNFIRLQDVTLSYEFDKKLIERLNINALKVFVSGKNLLTLTKWEGLDPELGIGLTPDYPIMSNYSLGLNIEF